MNLLYALEGNNVRWPSKISNHETVYQMCTRLHTAQASSGNQQWHAVRDYYKFGFVRNPWERISSLYRYLKEKRPKLKIDSVGSFSDFLEQANNGVQWIRELHSMRPQCDFFRSQRSAPLSADFIGHYEYLAEDFAAVARKLGIPPVRLPHLNRSSNSNVDYRPGYTDRSIEIVRSLFHEDIELFGYTFEHRKPVRGPREMVPRGRPRVPGENPGIPGES